MKPFKISAHSDKHSDDILLWEIQLSEWAEIWDVYLDKHKSFVPKKILSVPLIANRWPLDVLTFLIHGFVYWLLGFCQRKLCKAVYCCLDCVSVFAIKVINYISESCILTCRLSCWQAMNQSVTGRDIIKMHLVFKEPWAGKLLLGFEHFLRFSIYISGVRSSSSTQGPWIHTFPQYCISIY